MEKDIAIALIIVSLLASGVFSILPAQANFKPAPLPHTYIQSDGSINPSSAPISRNGNVYTLTGNLNGTVLDIRRSNAVVDGAGFSIPGIGFDYSIILTGVNNVTIKNFKILNRNIGIHLNASSYCTITGNRISDGSYGIWLTDHSNGNVISGNSVDDCFYSIYLDHSRNNVLRNNSVVGYKLSLLPVSGQNLAVIGDVLEDFINDVDASNSVNGKPMYYWVNKQNAEVPPNAGCVALVNCTSITVQNQHLIQNKYGVLLAWTTASTVRENIMENNAVGIYLFQSSCNTIANNSVSSSNGIEDNEGHGIRIQSSYNNIISGNNVNSNQGAGICVSQSPGTRLLDNNVTGNTRTGITIINNSNQFVVFRNFLSGNMGVTLRVADCTDGAIVGNNITKNFYFALYLTGSLHGNSIYGNSFDDNGFDLDKDGINDIPQVYVSSTIASPAWDNGTIGNYWSDYLTLYPKASEIGASGIGDLPYVIDYYNIDHCPLMAPMDASNISIPEIAIPPLPTPTPPQSLPTATPVSPSYPSPPMSPPQTEQSTASDKQPQEGGNAESNPGSPSATYVVLAVVSVAIIAAAVAAIVLRRITRISRTREQAHSPHGLR